jgi:hypothetical protein
MYWRAAHFVGEHPCGEFGVSYDGRSQHVRDGRSRLGIQLLNQRGGFLRHLLYYFIAMTAAFLFVAFPAFSQNSRYWTSLGTPAFPIQDEPVGQASTQSPPQDQAASKPQDQNDQNQKEADKQKNDRMFFVMPNFFTVANEAHVPPITWKQKFVITAKGAFDPYEFVVVGILAGIRQEENAYPAFGQGMQGYAKRYGAAFADQVDGNIMVGAVYPSILRTDPRYFQLGKGGFVRRFGYAISRIFVTRRDSGGSLFNFPEFAGNATAITISNLYYPAADRGFSAGLNNWGVQMGLDAFRNELKEFWPDIHKHFVKKKNDATP